MRNQWRLLLLHHHPNSFLSQASTIRPAISLLHNQVPTTPSSSPSYPSLSSLLPRNTTTFTLLHRHLCSDSSATQNTPDQSVMLVDLFSKNINGTEISKELESRNVVITHDLVLSVLENLKSNHVTVVKFFDWVSKRHEQRLSSKCYNLMLKIVVNNGLFKEFWDMVDAMKKKGYGVSKGTFIEASKKFEDEDSQSDLEKLKGLFSKDLDETSAALRISKIVRKEVWDDDVEKQLKELGVSYSSELVKMVLEKLSAEPMKSVIFFRWVQESGLFKHDSVTYNAMLKVLGREDCIDRFWNIVDEMRNFRYEMEEETYVMVLGQFMKGKLLKDAIDLYEFAMNGKNKLPKEECTFLMKKIAAAKEHDIELFSRVARVFTENGFALEDSMLDAVLKSLTSVGRMSEYNKVLEVMLDCGFKPSGAMQGRVAFDLSSSRMQDEADEFIQKLEVCGLIPDHQMWAMLIEGHSVAGSFDKARDCLKKMIDIEGVDSAGCSLDMLVSAYCHRNRAHEACKVLSDFVNKEKVKPSHAIYKMVVSKLLVQKRFEDALSLLSLMKSDGFPPFLDPFIEYLSRRGSADEAMQFFKGMTVNKYPSTNVFHRVFEAFFKAGRQSEAQNLLAKCPQYIRNNADVLDLFYSMKSEKPVESPVMAA